MADQIALDKYQPTIGIECHVQLKTTSKLFARVSNDAREAPPNTTVSPICFGLPGVLPYLNEAAVELAVRAGLALNAKINPRSTFDRKHYFYPDLPKGYQITQYTEPIVGEGWVEFPLGGETVRVGIERAHLEEDAGKLTHPANADYSLVDLNRAGTPLLEIVSKPDIKSPAAAKAYARELYLLMKYADVSDVDLYHGHMRFDVNISVTPKESDKLGTRAEVKNLNSFRAVEKAAQFEFERQVELLEKGQAIVQETRGWNEDKGQTFSQRSKEEAHDYRYFPEPDLPPVELDDKFISTAKSALVRLPAELRRQLKELNLTDEVVETTLGIPQQLSVVLDVKARYGNSHARRVALWFINAVTELIGGRLAETESNKEPIPAEYFLKISEMIDENRLSSTAGTQLFLEVIKTSKDPEMLAGELNLLQVSDENELVKIIDQVIADNPKAAEDVKSGETKAIGFLVGQVMKASKGQANPALAQDIIKKQLGQ